MNTDSSKDTEHDSDHASRKPAGDSNDALIEPRRDYTTSSLSRADLDTDPVAQFRHWLADARAAKLVDATAMVLATVDEHSRPHSRVVLLKRADASGFAWYTFQDSDKGRQIAAQPYAALLFYWCALERQVRIEGRVERLDPSEADDYFYSRPEGSRFSAAASQQSAPVASLAAGTSHVCSLECGPRSQDPHIRQRGRRLACHPANAPEFSQARAGQAASQCSRSYPQSNSAHGHRQARWQ